MKVSRLRSMRFVLAAMAVVIWSAGMAGLADATTYFAKRPELSVQVVYGKNHKVQSFEADYTMRCTSGRKYQGRFDYRRSDGWKPPRLPNGSIGERAEISSDEDSGAMGYSFKLKQGKVTGSFFFYDAVNPTASGDGTVDPPYECWTGRGPGDYDSDVHFVAKKR